MPEGKEKFQSPLLSEGEQVYLRKPRSADCGEFVALVQTSRRFLHPWVTPPSSPKTYAVYLRYARLSRVCACLVCRVQDHRILGVCNLSRFVRGKTRTAYLGYWVGAKYSGCGYMTEALRLSLGYGFNHLGLQSVEANILPGNVRSKALAWRVGLRMEGFVRCYLTATGRWEDHERWAAHFQHWNPRLP